MRAVLMPAARMARWTSRRTHLAASRSRPGGRPRSAVGGGGRIVVGHRSFPSLLLMRMSCARQPSTAIRSPPRAGMVQCSQTWQSGRARRGAVRGREHPRAAGVDLAHDLGGHSAYSPSLNSQSLSAWRSWRVFSIEPTVPQVMASGSGAEVVVGDGDLDAVDERHRGGVVLHVGGERPLVVLDAALLAGRGDGHRALLRGGGVHASMTAWTAHDIKASGRDDPRTTPCVRKRSECRMVAAPLGTFADRRAPASGIVGMTSTGTPDQDARGNGPGAVQTPHVSGPSVAQERRNGQSPCRGPPPSRNRVRSLASCGAGRAGSWRTGRCRQRRRGQTCRRPVP